MNFPARGAFGNIHAVVGGFARGKRRNPVGPAGERERRDGDGHAFANSAADQSKIHGTGTEDADVISAWLQRATHSHGHDATVFGESACAEGLVGPIAAWSPLL